MPDLFQSNDLLVLEDLVKKITRMIKNAGFDKNILRSLPLDFLRVLNIEASESAVENLNQISLPLFLKEISQHSVQLKNTTQEHSSSPLQRFTLSLEKELEKIQAGDIDLNLLRELSNVKLEEYLPSKDAAKLSSMLTSKLDVVNSSAEVGTTFCALLENFFSMLSEDDKDASSGITQCINQIGDHADIYSDAAKFEMVRDKMSWYLLTTPRMTVYRLLLQSLENKLIVPGVVKMLSFYPVLLQIQIKSEKVVSERVPLLFDLIVSIFEEHSHRWTNAEQQDRLVYLLASLCRRKRPTKVKDSEDVIKSPLMGAVQSVLDGGTLLRFFVVPNLMKRVHEVLMLKLLLR
ncbi:hypothetical protein NECAME_09091 [Necator americanus]|uniref:Edg1 TPR repeats region domain-containing protein n=1 Tax=Necator americanus TaxID=51031 RepID=W2TFC1_NECAM|nr:hypothetical protein NECAME_09091 [Necator americanus]ETN80543.1 hypothetical protein NECAME_09091 [Necator americanus]